MKHEIESLFGKTADETGNFASINNSVFVKYPKAIKIFRLMSGCDQRSFAALIGKNQQWVSAIERGFIHGISKSEAEKIALSIRKMNLQKVELNEIMRLEIEIANKGRFKGEYARKMALKAVGRNSVRSAESQKPTPQEKKIATVLRKQGIDFQMHKPIYVGKITFVCDFVLGGLPTVIEAKHLTTKYRTKALIAELAYKALRIKRFYPKAKLFAVINRDATMANSERLILKEEFDSLFFEDELEKLAGEISKSGFER
ncbi:TPA: helix-turn-helix transcriptional regulator [Candidatus Micrarchaeota archaeon]|nr:helix-turn-helix transcriptional regulator [Candidatus Micrarchaeota archaeon]